MKKFIFSDNGTLNDYSYKVEDYHANTVTIDYTSAQDYIFIGSELAFNSLFFDLSTANTASTAVTVEHWDGSSWEEMVDVIDETSLSGASFGQSGYITWTPNKQKVWQKNDTVKSNGSVEITGLGDVTIYDLYWIRISFSNTLDIGTTLNWIGPKFCKSNDVDGEYRLLAKSAFKTSYESGKTDWEKEIILASRLLIEDLKSKEAIVDGDQLLERRLFKDACVSKVAEIVFTNLGDDYVDDAKRAQTEYKSRLNKKNYKADKNNNARLDKQELGVSTGGLYR